MPAHTAAELQELQVPGRLEWRPPRPSQLTSERHGIARSVLSGKGRRPLLEMTADCMRVPLVRRCGKRVITPAAEGASRGRSWDGGGPCCGRLPWLEYCRLPLALGLTSGARSVTRLPRSSRRPKAASGSGRAGRQVMSRILFPSGDSTCGWSSASTSITTTLTGPGHCSSTRPPVARNRPPT